jgi:membrane-associated protein
MDEAVLLLTKYKYLILFPLAVFEGPIITVIVGFLVKAAIFNPIFALLVIVPGDVTGDSIYYSIGRYSTKSWLYKLANFLGVNEAKIIKTEDRFFKNPHKAIPLSKIMFGVGIAGLYLAGRSKIPYTKFLGICALTSIVQCSIYISIGYFFGYAYEQINSTFNYLAIGCITAAVAALLFYLIRNKYTSK